MFLGLDLGTSGLRGLLMSEEGAAVGSASADYPVSNPHPGWSEQDPQDWIDACITVMNTLRADHPAAYGAIKGVGIAGQMHGATLLDARNRVLRPCILWNDGRAAAEAAMLDADPAFRAISGNIVFPGFTAPKLVWVAKHEPDVFARIAKVLLPKDYLVHWLTGELVSEMSDAAGASWLDTDARAWSPELIEKSGMRPDMLPDLIEGSAPAGSVTTARTAELGLPPGVVVVGGGGDNAAAACGVGAFDEGDGFISLGTSGVLLAARDAYAPDPATAVHTFCHAVPDRWYQMGVILSATDSLNWLASLLGKTPHALSAALPEAPGGPAATQFLPYLSGERTPHNDAAARGAFIGLSRASGETDLTQAVMEGVGFALADCLTALRATGADLQRVLAIGGGAQSPFWLRTMANILDLPLDLPTEGDFGAAAGAARLAMIGAGGASPETVLRRPEVVATIEPDTRLKDHYSEARARFAKGYPALKELL